MTDCIFCKIIAGEIPSYKVYEDDETYAFLDINPISDGHTLVVPKQHVLFVHHLNEPQYQAVMATVRKVMQALEKALNPARVGVIIEGFDVDHAHVKVFPLFDPKDIQTVHVKETPEGYFEEMAKKVRNGLAQSVKLKS